MLTSTSTTNKKRVILGGDNWFIHYFSILKRALFALQQELIAINHLSIEMFFHHTTLK